MKRMMGLTKVAAMGLLVMVSTAAWAAKEEGAGRIDAGQLRGAWKVMLTPGEGGPPPFLVLMVLTRDGIVVETDAGPPNPLQFSPGIGEWGRKDDGRYAVSYTQMEFDSGQNHIGMFDALMDVNSDEDKTSFEGTVRVRFFDLNDILLFEGTGTVKGKRLPVK